MTPGGLSDLERARKLTWDDILPGGYDPYARIKVMDEEVSTSRSCTRRCGCSTAI